MNQHEKVNSSLEEYVADKLSPDIRREIESHLHSCNQCKEDVIFWRMVSKAIQDSNRQIPLDKDLVEQVLAQNKSSSKGFSRRLLRGWSLFLSQIPLVRRDIWSASIAIMLIGYLAAILAGREIIVQVLAPMVAAASIATILGSNNDPVIEIVHSVPTSMRQLILARMTILFVFNLVLSMVSSICLLPFLSDFNLWSMILGWLAPMSFLSALGLFLSTFLGTENAIVIGYSAWILRFIFQSTFSLDFVNKIPVIQKIFTWYSVFWQQSLLLILAAVCIVSATFWLLGRIEFRSRYAPV